MSTVIFIVLVKKKKNKRMNNNKKKKILYIFEKITIKSVRVFCVFEVLIMILFLCPYKLK